MVRRKLAAVVPRNLNPWNPAQPVVAAIARTTRVRTGVRDDGRSPSMSLSPTPPSMAIGTEGSASARGPPPSKGLHPPPASQGVGTQGGCGGGGPPPPASRGPSVPTRNKLTRRDRRAATHHSRTAG